MNYEFLDFPSSHYLNCETITQYRLPQFIGYSVCERTINNTMVTVMLLYEVIPKLIITPVSSIEWSDFGDITNE